VLELGLFLLLTVGVRCFAIIGENNQDKQRPRSNLIPPPTIAESVTGRRSLSLASRLLGKKDEDGSQIPDDVIADASVNITSSNPMEVLAPEVPPVPLEHSANTNTIGSWPCFDKMDRELIKISLPVIGNYAINPLIGAVDLFWVNRMGNALAVAGQAAANQVFSSAFWFTSFLPSGKESILCRCENTIH